MRKIRLLKESKLPGFKFFNKNLNKNIEEIKIFLIILKI